MKRSASLEPWMATAAAAALLAVTMGSRSSFGLFVSPLNTATGVGLGVIGLAAAVSQLAWGAAQPVWGLFAERYGAARVIAIGCLALAATSALLPFVQDALGLVVACALIAITGAAAGSNSLLLGEVSRRVSPAARGIAVGIVGAGGSAGQLVLGPATQAAISGFGWQNAAMALALLALFAAPFAWLLRRARRVPAAPLASTAGRAVASTAAPTAAPTRAPAAPASPAAPRSGARSDIRAALANRDFWCVAAGFFVCGFHVAFLTTHMPGVIEACGFTSALAGQWLAIVGLFNIVGSIGIGFLIRRASMKHTLSVLYALRALGIVLFVAVPVSEASMLAFAVWIGLTYMATLPPTSGLVARLFGVERLATLLGLVMFSHQLGASLGAWLGGALYESTGGYGWVWAVDVALALLACLVHLPVREPVAGAETTLRKPGGNIPMPNRNPAIA